LAKMKRRTLKARMKRMQVFVSDEGLFNPLYGITWLENSCCLPTLRYVVTNLLLCCLVVNLTIQVFRSGRQSGIRLSVFTHDAPLNKSRARL